MAQRIPRKLNDLKGTIPPAALGIYVGTSAPGLVTYAEWLATGTGYWSWIDISAAGGGAVTVSATVTTAAGTAAATPITAAAVRYVTAALQPAGATGSAAPITAVASQDGVTNAAAVIVSAQATGAAQALVAAAVRYVAATVGSASGDGAAAPITATASTDSVVNASAVLGSASGAGTAQALTAAAVKYVTATVGAAAGAGGANAISAAAVRYMTATLGAAGATGAAGAITAAASGGGGGSTIAEYFDATIATTYAQVPTYPSNMAATATVQGWTVASSGTDPAVFDAAYDYFAGAYIRTATGGFAGNRLDIFGCHTEDAESSLIAGSGFKISKTFTGAFSAGTFSIKYYATPGTPTVTIKVNGVSVGALTFNSTWRTATLSVGAGSSILLEIECAPTVKPTGIPSISIDNIEFS